MFGNFNFFLKANFSFDSFTLFLSYKFITMYSIIVTDGALLYISLPSEKKMEKNVAWKVILTLRLNLTITHLVESSVILMLG
jgi:hypothetical protein